MLQATRTFKVPFEGRGILMTKIMMDWKSFFSFSLFFQSFNCKNPFIIKKIIYL